MARYLKSKTDTATARTTEVQPVTGENSGLRSHRWTEPLLRDHIKSLKPTKDILCTLNLNHLRDELTFHLSFRVLSLSGTRNQWLKAALNKRERPSALGAVFK